MVLATMENSVKLPQKHRTTVGSSQSISGCLSEENKNTNSQRYMHLNVHSSIINNSEDRKAT